jgi:16S rRNA (cytosine1402-N4)-methyltransferase
MRIDRQQELSALELVNRLSERELADLIYFNAQERFSRRIAKRICQARHRARIRSTRHLAEVVASAVQVDPLSRKSRIHPATRTFLALRMAVNQEQENLRLLLSKAPGVLAPDGRIAVISFHSVEDREVKVDFRTRVRQGLYTIVNKRPVIAGPAEREVNPRSRSAKLRVAERTAQPFSAHLEHS